MSIEEVKSLLEQDQKATKELRDKVAELDKKYDAVTNDVAERIKAELAEIMTKTEAANAEIKARVEDLAQRREIKAPGDGAAATDEAKAFAAWLRKDEKGLSEKAMSSLSQVDGGYLAPTTMVDGIQSRLRRTSPMRAFASAFTANELELLVERGDAGFEWAGETQTRNDTDSPTLNKITIQTHELSALPKISQRLLDTATFDVGGWLEGYVADRFGRAEATSHFTGQGVNTPKGILTYPTAAAADDARAAATLQFRITGAAGAFATTGPADVFTQAYYDLQPEYQANAAWMMKNTTAATVATLKDGDGRYLLQSMMNADGTLLRTIHGRPVGLANDMPAIADDALAIAFGDFERGYAIVDNGTMRVLRDPYSAKPNVLFYATKRVGGGVIDFDAIKFIKMAD